MKNRLICALAGLLLAACGSTNRNPNQQSGTAGSSVGGTTAAGGDAAGGDNSEACTPDAGVTAPAGLVRLTFNELNAGLIQLFGAEATKVIGAAIPARAAAN